MGDVIRPNFGGKPRTAEAPQEPEQVNGLSQNEELLFEDFKYCLKNEDRVREAIRQSDTITDYIFDLANFRKKDESVALRQGAMKAVPLETLCSHLLDSNELQWKQQPHFYGATIVELHERCQVINHMKEVVARGPDDSTSQPPE